MKQKNPIKGLLMFSFHAASGNVAILLLVCIIASGVFLATGWEILFMLLVTYSATVFPLYILMSMGQNEKWERFQLSMPIRRSTLLRMQYASMVLFTIVPILLVIAVTALGVLLQRDIFEDGFGAAMLGMVPPFAMPFFIAGTALPLASSKVGRGKEGLVLNISFFTAIGLMMFTPQIADRFALSLGEFGVWVAAISGFLFIVSYPISRWQYARIDF